MKYVRWKRYGFTHAMEDDAETSLCGHWWHDFVFTPSFMEREPGLLPPSDQDDDKRPFCGVCRKALAKKEKR